MTKAKVKELSPQDPDFLPVQYDLTKAQLAKLAHNYDVKLIPTAVEKGDEGYLEIHSMVMDITKVRTNIDKVRKTLKADALAWGKKVDGEAKRLTKIVEDLEEPWRKIKTELDEKEAREAREAAEAEEKRQAEIEKAIKGIRSLGEGLLGKSAAEIYEVLTAVETMTITKSRFGEYTEAAEITRTTIHSSLVAAWKERTEFEANQEELKKQQAELAAGQAELKKQKDELEASERASKALKEKEDQRKADVKAELERKAEANEAVKRTKASLKRRLPQDKILQRFARELAEVPVPEGEITDHDLIIVLDDATDYLSNAISCLLENTQEVK